AVADRAVKMAAVDLNGDGHVAIAVALPVLFPDGEQRSVRAHIRR
ncbi:MAG: hypothetical protein ACI89X_005146, partial [Planctomycetota bacterium]